MKEIFPLELIPEIKKAPENFRLLRQLPENFDGCEFRSGSGDNRSEMSVVFLDLETTGLNPASDKAIQLAMIKTICDAETGRILRVADYCEMLEDPGRKLPPEIRSLTGISDSDLKGQSFDYGRVSRILSGGPLVVAHNASFDRTFFDKRFPKLARLSWGCTLKDPNWRNAGFQARSLEQLLLKSGFFFTGHNALTDARATVWLMHLHPERMLELLSIADAGIASVDALGSPFDSKDLLKQRGYRWNAKNRYWSKEVAANQINEEKAFLDGLYGGGNKARIKHVPASARFR
ncbi:MAG: 3'-5' exonuclease [Albidovulum sp.]|nr:3'-5' exonuclease [Albidovulum sp.]MDE0532647.1 3'-5' exonuclease [Albidovulum sp.]